MSAAQLAPGVRRPSPELLVGGSPLRVLRLTAAGAEALGALLTGREHPGVTALRRRLLEAGLLLLPPGPSRLDEVTVVVPVRGSEQEVQETLSGVPAGVRVVVVDDGSDPPLTGAVRLPISCGPAAARNVGAAQASTPLVAFVDAGVRLPAGALERLSGHFHDERVVAAAPRVVSGPGRGGVGVLEHSLCALDQGAEPAEVRPGSVVSYVPSTALVVRRDALDAVGGFDEALHVGEDVDLVWRLGERGVIRYDPDVVVRHAPRTQLSAALRRRRDYGESAGPLDARHPGRLRHLRVSWWSALPWAAALVHPAAGPLMATGLVAAAPRRLPLLPAAEARRLAVEGQVASCGATGRYAVRPAAPLTAALLLCSRRARRTSPLLAAAYVLGSWPRVARGPVRQLPVRIALHVAEDAAYSAGVWRSALRARRPRVLMPGPG